MTEANYERVVNAVKRNPLTIVFKNKKDGISCSKSAMTLYHQLVGLGRIGCIIGVYDQTCPPAWIEDDLSYCGVKSL